MEWLKKIREILEKRDIRVRKKGKEKIWNIPNPITFLRIVITFIIIYMFIIGSSLLSIILVFMLGALTDFFDGYFARKLNQITEFGRQFDIIADRFLLIVTVLGIIIMLTGQNMMNNFHLIQIFLIMSRELITSPFALLALIWGKRTPDVRFIGKLATALQGVTFPMIVLSVFYPIFNFSIFFSVLTCILGLFSGLYYIRDLNLGTDGKNG